MKKAAIFLTAISIITGTISVNAASVLRESLLCYATTEQVTVAENLIGGILDEVENGWGMLMQEQNQMSLFSTLGLTDKRADMLTVN